MACFVPDRTSLTSTFVPVAILFILGNYECFQLSSPVPYTEPNGNDESSSSLLESLRLPLDSEYEIVAPYEVDQQGEYVSHAVAHHHRRRRSAEGFGTILGGMAHFRLHGLGEDFHLELSPAYGLITPGFMVQTLGKNGSKSLQPFLEQEFCFYQGSVRSKANSSVALSTCTGMARHGPRDHLGLRPSSEGPGVGTGSASRRNWPWAARSSPTLVVWNARPVCKVDQPSCGFRPEQSGLIPRRAFVRPLSSERRSYRQPSVGRSDRLLGRQALGSSTSDLAWIRARVRSVCVFPCNQSGLIRTEQADYFLRPLHQQQLWAENYTAPPDHYPHILYKRHTSPQTSGGRERRHTPPQTGAERDRISSTVQKRHGKETELMDAFRDKRRPRLSTHEHTELGNGYHGRHNRHSNYRHGTQQRQHYCGRRKKYVLKPPGKDLYILPDEYSRFPARSKRAPGPPARPNQKLNVETLVVVDQKMMENHGRENITTYVLTVLNMVSTLFKDRTIGGDINIVIVGLILLPEDQEGLVISHHADHTLNSFCQWQSGLTGREGRRHDHAILLTGLDICSWKNEPCDTLGLAPISGMCSKYRSCTINEDTGLGLAFTIAHESGHNFGMVHDGEGNVCKKSVGNIMSPTLAGHNGLFSWSFCSRQYLSRFLSTAQATCLSDEPHAAQEYRYPEKLPGELYDTDTQCKWQFGVKAKLCMLNFKKARTALLHLHLHHNFCDICKALWCHRVGRKCETKFMPAAEGSVCGPEMWCRRGQCVKQGEEGPRPVHGQWSSWSIWSSCSRTCESGVTYRERHCNSPKPASGGRFCEGSSRSYKLCNTEDCPQNSVDFRAAQCAEFNSKPFRGWYYTWRPYTRVDDQDMCKLYCFAEGYDFFFALSSRVLDGTRCTEDSPNVCVDGLCERVGCDGVLGSMAELDMCGVCNGNNSTCKIYEGKYTKQHYTNDYYAVVTIPAGARSIHIAELNSSSSYLALRNTHRKYYLNGQWTVNWPGRRSVAGAVFYYRRPYNQPESLTSTGPTNETLVVEASVVLVDGGQAGVWWEYAVTSRGTENKHSYSWAVIPTQCSATCGRGEMITKASCYRDLRVQVNTSSCNARTRPSTGVQPCNTQPCPPSWIIGDWSTCSRTCSSGEQRRQVQCAQRTGPTQSDVLEDSRCVRPPPARTQACNTHTCPAAWVTGPWSQCSRKCAKGLRKRTWTAVCMSGTSGPQTLVLPDSMCVVMPRPRSLQNCVTRRCHKPPKTQWILSAWQQPSSLFLSTPNTPALVLSLCVSHCLSHSFSLSVPSLPACYATVLCDVWGRRAGPLCEVCGEGYRRETRRTGSQEVPAYAQTLSQAAEAVCPAGVPPWARHFLASLVHLTLVPGKFTLPLNPTTSAWPYSPPTPPQPHSHPSYTPPQPQTPLNLSRYTQFMRFRYLKILLECCTVSCGGGVQLRSVQCLVHGRPSPGCSAQLKPSASQTCNTAYCHQHPHQGVVCADSYSWCHLVPQHGVCSHRFYGKQCCKSCSHTSV
ncbi:hypothetical protein P4O66_009962 [Electrophorus voltai]|uniref:Peptidase M12B domain-containing protein n=1 Tax=Electrophorus voltai TaxID=2609070 RepID=A0AAD8ZB83_9TELE|nr:hypothetical protein P4O66_009962 [Electrophorus voltai]